MRSVGRSARLAAATAASLLFFNAPLPAAAHVTVSVEFVYGSVAVGGVGLFVALSGSWETLTADGAPPDTLVEVGGSRVRFGIPFTLLPASANREREEGPAGGLLLNFVRWRF